MTPAQELRVGRVGMQAAAHSGLFTAAVVFRTGLFFVAIQAVGMIVMVVVLIRDLHAFRAATRVVCTTVVVTVVVPAVLVAAAWFVGRYPTVVAIQVAVAVVTAVCLTATYLRSPIT